MPLTFENRERGFEAKFALEEELRFRIAARRDKLFVHWVSERQQLSASDTESLLNAVMAVPDGPGHQEGLLAIVLATLADGGGDISKQSLEAAMASCAERAREQLHGPPGAEYLL